jgi:hypothetical protein
MASTKSDLAGNALARAAGYRADLVRGSLDNTGVYRALYAALFDKLLN